MVKRTHLDLSVKCGSTPTRPGLEKWKKDGGRIRCNFLLALHAIIEEKKAYTVQWVLRERERKENRKKP